MVTRNKSLRSTRGSISRKITESPEGDLTQLHSLRAAERGRVSMSLLEKSLRSKAFVWTLLVLPGLWPLWPIFIRPDPSVAADPLKYVLHHLGFIACILLATVLAFTPLRVLWP